MMSSIELSKVQSISFAIQNFAKVSLIINEDLYEREHGFFKRF